MSVILQIIMFLIKYGPTIYELVMKIIEHFDDEEKAEALNLMQKTEDELCGLKKCSKEEKAAKIKGKAETLASWARESLIKRGGK